MEKQIKTYSDRKVLNKAIDTDNHKVLKEKFRVMIERELSSTYYDLFLHNVDEFVKAALLSGGRTWHHLGNSIISDSIRFNILKETKEKMPLCHLFFATHSISPSQRGRSRSNSMTQ